MLLENRFREDLYHGLAVFPVRLPPLRDRRRDILPLATTLLERIGRQLEYANLELDGEARKLLVEAHWPGRVRELANLLERAAILSAGKTIPTQHLSVEPTPVRESQPAEVKPLADLEREAIEKALVLVGGNRRVAAERLGIGLRTLYDKLKRYGLE